MTEAAEAMARQTPSGELIMEVFPSQWPPARGEERNDPYFQIQCSHHKIHLQGEGAKDRNHLQPLQT